MTKYQYVQKHNHVISQYVDQVPRNCSISDIGERGFRLGGLPSSEDNNAYRRRIVIF